MLSSSVLPRPVPAPGAPVQPPVDIASLNINVPVPPPVPAPVAALNGGRERDPQLVRRVRELEEEVRNLRTENEKQVRFRFRDPTGPPPPRLSRSTVLFPRFLRFPTRRVPVPVRS